MQPTKNSKGTTSGTSQPKTPRRKRKQDLPLQEIRYFQNSTQRLIPRAPFGRLLKEIFQLYGEYRTTPEALTALQEASEIYLVQLFEDAYRCTAHRGRKTLTAIDIQLVRYIRGVSDVGN